MAEQQFDQNNRVIAPMREAVFTVWMLAHRRLVRDVVARRPELSRTDRVRLAAAALHNLFGTEPEDRAAAEFASRERPLVEAELRLLADSLGDLRPLVTDALRMHCICEEQEGRHAAACVPPLLMARALGVLEEDRPLPLPSTFMSAVRVRAAVEGVVRPMAAPDEGEEAEEEP